MIRTMRRMLGLALVTGFAACAVVSCDQIQQSRSGSSQSDQFEKAKSRFEERVGELKKDTSLKDWFGKEEHVRYDIKRSDSAIAPYEGIIYLTHYEGDYTASYTYQFKDGMWRFLKSDSSRVQRNIDELMKVYVY